MNGLEVICIHKFIQEVLVVISEAARRGAERLVARNRLEVALDGIGERLSAGPRTLDLNHRRHSLHF